MPATPSRTGPPPASRGGGFRAFIAGASATSPQLSDGTSRRRAFLELDRGGELEGEAATAHRRQAHVGRYLLLLTTAPFALTDAKFDLTGTGCSDTAGINDAVLCFAPENSCTLTIACDWSPGAAGRRAGAEAWSRRDDDVVVG